MLEATIRMNRSERRLAAQTLCAFAVLAALATGNALAEDTPVVDTGQTGCYDDVGARIECPESGDRLYGQDAQYTGNEPDFRDNGNRTITDEVTGLTWQRTPDDMGLSWQEAYDYCQLLELGGYADWRLPSTKELFSISDFSHGWPYLNTTYFDIAGRTVSKDEQYWTERYVGTTAQGGPAAAFGVNHGTGHIKAYPEEVSGFMGNYARCVRGENYGANSFADNGDGTVSDHATGLMWQQADGGYGMNWEDALDYAESTVLAGYDDWRLPSVKELQSIVDYTKSPSAADTDDLGPAIDTDFFEISELPGGTTNFDTDYPYFWTSTSAYFGTHAREYLYAWYVAFGTASDSWGADGHGAGAVRFDAKTDANVSGSGDAERVYNYVRLVRVGGVTSTPAGSREAERATPARGPGGRNEPTSQSAGAGEMGGPGGPPPGARGSDSTGQKEMRGPGGPPSGSSSEQRAQSGTRRGGVRRPPQEAIAACSEKNEGDSCSFSGPRGDVTGTCTSDQEQLACAPEGGPPGDRRPRR